MKRTYLQLVLLTTISLIFAGCYPKPAPAPTFPTYNYGDPIVNPPDVFEILYNMSLMGDQTATVTFKSDAVWKIEKLGDNRIGFAVANDSTAFIIASADTLGLKSGFKYKFIANNNNYTDFNSYFVHFTKLPIDYGSFDPKF